MLFKTIQEHKKKILIAFLSGLFFLFAFPPFYMAFLAPLALAMLLYLIINAGSRKEAFYLCFFSGIIFNTGLLYWIVFLMEEGLIAVLILGGILFMAYMSFWTGLTAVLVRFLSERRRLLGIITFPFIWTGQEKLRELGQMSFPWVTSGYTFGEYTRLLQFGSVFGVYFYSFLICVTASLFYFGFENRQNRKYVQAVCGILFLLYGSLFIYGSVRMNRPLPGRPLKTALVQANVDQNVKWNKNFKDSIFLVHKQMSEAAAKEKVDLIVWSESAVPCYFLKSPIFRSRVKTLVDSLDIPLIFGSLDYTVSYGSQRQIDYYNSVFYYYPGSHHFFKYDKIRLVPFGEMLPFEGYFPIISKVDLGESDFTPGSGFKFFKLNNAKLFSPICYEVVYPEQMRSFVNAGGTCLVHLTNDGWYGRSGMPFQHANIARFRALENGIPLIRCANTGVSCFIDQFGRITKKTPIYIKQNLIGSVNLGKIDTFYSRHGDWIGWCCLWATLLYFLFVLIKQVLWKKR